MSGPADKAWRCGVCGYVHRGASAPASCPICGSAQADFDPYVELAPPGPATAAAAAAAAGQAGTWRCLNCRYVHVGGAPPAACPVCGAPQDRFEASAQPTPPAPHGGRVRVVIVGAGVAGVSAAEAVRAADGDAEIVLLSRESHLPYYRLNLTRYLAGEITPADLPIHPANWYADNRIQLLLAAEAATLRLADRAVELRGGRVEPYDKLILTAGAHPFVPPIPGAQREGVTCLRTVDDARAILAGLRAGTQCVCIGGGILGLETAGAMARRGAAVTLIEGHGWLMPRQLPEPAARRLHEHVEGLGICLRTNGRTKEIVGDEKAAGVLLEDGQTLHADLIVLAAGVRPNSYLARRAGLEIGDGGGIVVDDHLATSHADVLAAGDIAEHRGVLYGTWGPAQYMGAIAGANALGPTAEFGGMPRSNTLKVLGLALLSIGQFQAEDAGSRVVEGRDDGRYMRFVFRDGRMIGTVLVGDTSISAALKKTIEGRTDASGLLAGEPAAQDVFERLAAPAAPAEAATQTDHATYSSTQDKPITEKTMPELKGSKTEKCLQDAFAGESQARNKYTYFASVARKEGYEQIAAMFLETAENEKEHAKLHLAFLGGIGDTAANLKAAAGGENHEWTSMYPGMAKTAREDGFDDIARLFDGLAKIEKEHEARYQKLLANLEGAKVFAKQGKVKWRCRNCGFVHEGEKAAPMCPVCKHPQAYFEVVAEGF